VVGASLLPYSPDFNPIENAFAKLKALLGGVAEPTVDGLWDRIGNLIDSFTPQECANYFAAAGYDASERSLRQRPATDGSAPRTVQEGISNRRTPVAAG
jgi:hypothetical protein